MRLILCSYDNSNLTGGPVVWMKRFSLFLSEKKINFKLLIIYSGDSGHCSLINHCIENNFDHDVIDWKHVVFMEDQVEWILERCSAFRPSVFLANLVLPAFYAARWLKEAGIATIGVIHSGPENDPFYKDMIDCFVGGSSKWRLECVVCVSEDIARYLLARNYFAVKVKTISCGTPIPSYNFPLQDGVLRILYAGRLVQKAKRIRELTQSFSMISNYNGIKTSICGGGPEENFVRKIAGRQENMEYLGHIPSENMESVFRRHNIIVLLSDFEGLPMSLLEGMAYGLVPVCLEHRGGVSEIIENGRNGFLVKNREKDFENAILRLKNLKLLLQMSSEAKKTVEDRYSTLLEFQRWVDLFVDLSNPNSNFSWEYPKKVCLKHHREHFKEIQKFRPGTLQKLKFRTLAIVTRLRFFFRPRSRVKSLIKKFQKERKFPG